MHRQSGVDDGVDQHDVTALDLGIQILEEPNAVVVLAVACELDEVEVVMDLGLPGQVADERDARLQGSDEQRLPALVVVGDLDSDFSDTSSNLVGVEKDLADSLVELGQRAQDAFRSP